jgi:hypothetical protein
MMIARLLAQITINREETKPTKPRRTSIKWKCKNKLLRMEIKIEANNAKFEILRDTLASRVDIHQERTETIQE